LVGHESAQWRKSYETDHQNDGDRGLTDLAAKAGLSTQDLAARLSTILPQVVDKLTPNGRVS